MQPGRERVRGAGRRHIRVPRPAGTPAVTTLFLTALFAAIAPARAVDEAAVDASIQQGIQSLLARISEEDQIQYYRSRMPPATERVRGRVTSAANGFVEIKTHEGETLRIPRDQIIVWSTPGHVDDEMRPPQAGGPSALAALALVTAGVPVNEPRLSPLLVGLAEDQSRESGTYVHSLRAAVWAAILARPLSRAHQVKYKKLLTEEIRWLKKAMQPDGGYGYTATPGPGWDNSNTQFAHLGLWAGAVAGAEVANKQWQAVADHWLKTQNPSGGWSYHRENTTSVTPSMTIAGCNSLYIVLDRYYARAEEPYRLLEGVRPDKRIRAKMRAIYAAVERGDRFLLNNPPNIVQSSGYELFGLERLGLASGQTYIGERDWFRRYAEGVSHHFWGGDLVADCFALIFLVHGQAPVIIQKLEHGTSPDEWNYYSRDLAGLTRYLSRAFERLHRWQRLPPDATLRDMQDAPLLYISGHDRLDLPAQTLDRVRQYLDLGGTVFLHADRASAPFAESARRLFEGIYKAKGFRFERLPESHPVYHCHFGGDAAPWKTRVPLEGLSDGSRVRVFLCPADIAGAWHQDRTHLDDLFRIMANVRVYAAPPYAELPRRLRSDETPQPQAPLLRGEISLARFKYEGPWDVHDQAWPRYAAGLRGRTGITLHMNQGDAKLAELLKDHDILYLAAKKPTHLDNASQKALRAYLSSGGFLLIDAADGGPDAIASVRQWVDAIDVGDRGVLPTGHPIITGAMSGGRALSGLQTTDAGASLGHGNSAPPFYTRTLNGRVVLLACPFDLIAGMDGAHIWNRSGYQPDSTARIMDNILLWRLSEKTRPAARTPDAPRR